MRLETLYTSEPMTIGKTHWRVGVASYEIGRGESLCTFYEWSKCGHYWNDSRQWPTYDGNDTYNGLPKSLEKLYYREKEMIDHLIHDKPLTPNPQAGFNFGPR